MELYDILLIWAGGGAAVLLGLTVCFFGIRVQRLGWAVTAFLWAVACAMLVSFDMAGAYFTLQPEWYARFALAALVCAAVSAIWRKAGGALSAFFAGGTLVYFAVFALLNDTWGTVLAALPLFAALFGGLALAVPGALRPAGPVYVLAPFTGAVFAVAGVTELLYQQPLFQLYNQLLDGGTGRRGWHPSVPAWQLIAMAAAAGVLFAAGLICQLAALHRRKKAAAGVSNGAEEAPVPPPEVPEPQTAPQSADGRWTCKDCGTVNSARFCIHCGAPRS